MNESKKAFDILYDKRIPMKLNGKFYEIMVRPAMINKSKFWVVDRKIKQGLIMYNKNVKIVVQSD